MDQELKQRLIGAAVITALAAIFVPMLFDDPVDETGKNINSLKIPDLPTKVQDVEITPLPEKVEDVVSQPPTENSLKPVISNIDEGVQHGDDDLPHSKSRPVAKETEIAAKHPKQVEPPVSVIDEDVAAEVEDVPPPPVLKPTKLPQQPPIASLPIATRPLKPAVRPVEQPPAPENTTKQATPASIVATGNETGARWYLNVGSFSQKANALALQDTLKQQGFSATVKETSGEKGLVFKVRVGPMLDKAKAQTVKNKLTQMNINSFVAPDE